MLVPKVMEELELKLGLVHMAHRAGLSALACFGELLANRVKCSLLLHRELFLSTAVSLWLRNRTDLSRSFLELRS